MNSGKMPRLKLGVGVGADFAVQINVFVLRGGPFHCGGSFLFENGLLDTKKITQEIAEGKPNRSSRYPGRYLIDEEEAKLFYNLRSLVLSEYSPASTFFSQTPRI